jgi:hypothetical protein
MTPHRAQAVTIRHAMPNRAQRGGRRLVVLALAAACASTEAATMGDPTGPTGVLAALVGTWRETAASGSQVCDELGHCSIAYGGSESYTFTADGHFEFAQQLEGNVGGCRIVTSLYARGTVSGTGARITLSSTYAHDTKAATCESGFDIDLRLDPTSYTWRLARDGGGRAQLYLTGAGNVETGPYDRAD